MPGTSACKHRLRSTKPNLAPTIHKNAPPGLASWPATISLPSEVIHGSLFIPAPHPPPTSQQQNQPSLPRYAVPSIFRRLKVLRRARSNHFRLEDRASSTAIPEASPRLLRPTESRPRIQVRSHQRARVSGGRGGHDLALTQSQALTIVHAIHATIPPRVCSAFVLSPNVGRLLGSFPLWIDVRETQA